MKFSHKLFFLEGVLLYVLLLIAGIEALLPDWGSVPAAKLQQDTESGETLDAYKELPKKVALTFDDGPDGRYTEELLDGLKKRSVKATFFVTGEKAEEFPELIKRMQEDGHLIGNHTYSHMQLTQGKEEAFKEELQKTNEILEEITGEVPLFVRPPFGTWKKEFEQELNMFPVLWTVDPLDWCSQDAGCVARNVLSKVGENDIILLHDQYPSSINAAFEIVDALQKEGYEFVTVGELMLE